MEIHLEWFFYLVRKSKLCALNTTHVKGSFTNVISFSKLETLPILAIIWLPYSIEREEYVYIHNYQKNPYAFNNIENHINTKITIARMCVHTTLSCTRSKLSTWWHLRSIHRISQWEKKKKNMCLRHTGETEAPKIKILSKIFYLECIRVVIMENNHSLFYFLIIRLQFCLVFIFNHLNWEEARSPQFFELLRSLKS